MAVVEGDRPPSGAVLNQVNGPVWGTVIQIRDVYGDVFHLTESPVPRSTYREQIVQRLAPKSLIDRDAELDELAAFCRSSGDEGYLWLQAPAWAGKTALMSSFVLRPPPGVRLVSFFITARHAWQAELLTFIRVVGEQLAEVLEEPLPAGFSPETGEAHLLDMLERAAEHCQQAGDRLVLVVDGLDEDQGLTVGPDRHSIAAVLPAGPPDGLRVIVSGRSHPPLPVDVPRGHPLRWAASTRTLSRSPHARVVQEDLERELDRLLLDGGDEQRALLGLLVAAGGGLTPDDLADLTETSVRQVLRYLTASIGRTLIPLGRPEDAGDWGYILAHEELQRKATSWIGSKRVAAYRDQLHEWAERHRSQGWRTKTPRYLLSGYFALLRDTQDHARMMECATDTARLDRMFQLERSDFSALAEIAITQDAVAGSVEPDLAGLAVLAIVREQLRSRSDRVPPGLPVVWQLCGDTDRAVALARSISWHVARTRVLGGLSRSLFLSGDVERATVIVDDVLTGIRSLRDPVERAVSMSLLVEALAGSGDPGLLDRLIEEAIADASFTSNVGIRSDIWSRLLRSSAWHRTSLAERAEAAIRSGDESDYDPEFHLVKVSRAIADIAEAAAAGGDYAGAARLAQSLPEGWLRDWALSRTVVAMSERCSGTAVDGITWPGGAVALCAEADRLASRIRDHYERGIALARLARAVAGTGDTSWARRLARRCERTARMISSPSRSASVLTELLLAGVFAATKRAALVRSVERLVVTPEEPYADEHRWTAAIVSAIAQAVIGKTDQAWIFEVAARAALPPMANAFDPHGNPQTAALAGLLGELGADDDPAGATVLAGHVSEIAESVTDLGSQGKVLAGLAERLAGHGRTVQAERLARSILDVRDRADALTSVASAAARAGDAAVAGNLAEEVELMVRAIQDPASTVEQVVELSVAVAAAGDHGRAAALTELAERNIRRVDNSYTRVDLMFTLSRAMCAIGDFGGAQKLITEGVSSWHRGEWDFDPYPYGAVQAWVELIRSLVAAGRDRTAQAVAHSVEDVPTRLRLTAVLAASAARHGDHTSAMSAISEALELRSRFHNDVGTWEELVEVAEAAAEVGSRQQVVILATDARAAAETFESAEARVGLLTPFIAPLARCGAVREALALLRHSEAMVIGCPQPGEARLLTGLAGAAAAVADDITHAALRSRAEASARSISEPHSRATELTRLVRLPRLTQFEVLALTAEVQRSIDDITDAHDRSYALAFLAEALMERTVAAGADHRVHEIAEEIAHSISDSYVSTTTLEKLVTTCRPTNAEAILSWVLRHSPGRVPLGACVLIRPESASRIVDRVLLSQTHRR